MKRPIASLIGILSGSIYMWIFNLPVCTIKSNSPRIL